MAFGWAASRLAAHRAWTLAQRSHVWNRPFAVYSRPCLNPERYLSASGIQVRAFASASTQGSAQPVAERLDIALDYDDQGRVTVTEPIHTQKVLLQRWEMEKQAAIQGGGEARVEKQHAKGKLTARERIMVMLDPGTFHELDMIKSSLEPGAIPGEGVVTGRGKIDGKDVYVYSQDFTVNGGTLSEAHGEKIMKVMNMAWESRVPIIGIQDSGGANIKKSVSSLAAYASIFNLNVKYSGSIPQISVICGPCAGGAVYSPGLTDFTFMVSETSFLFLTGPEVVRQALSEEVTFEGLGGAAVHARKSGVVHRACKDDVDALRQARNLLSFLPPSFEQPVPRVSTQDPVDRVDEALNRIIPEDSNTPYNMLNIVERIVDDGNFFEIQPEWAKSIIVGFGRFNGITTGIVANQPMHLAGVLDIDASCKAARFVRFCDAFNIPIVTLVDVPGFLPGSGMEHAGIIRHGSKLLYAYAEATVPKVSIITRKSYGGSHCCMSSKQLGDMGQTNYAYPGAEISVMGAKGAVQVLFQDALKKDKTGELRKKLEDEYQLEHCNAFMAAQRGYIDAIIEPKETRKIICSDLENLIRKKAGAFRLPMKKHDNLPL